MRQRSAHLTILVAASLIAISSLSIVVVGRERLSKTSRKDTVAPTGLSSTGSPASTAAASVGGTDVVDPNRPSREQAIERENAAVLTELGAPSVDTNNDWAKGVRAVFEKWASPGQTGESIKLGELKCYAKGCAVTVTYKNQAQFQSSNQRFVKKQDWQLWSGAKFRSGSIALATGAVNQIWVLYR